MNTCKLLHAAKILEFEFIDLDIPIESLGIMHIQISDFVKCTSVDLAKLNAGRGVVQSAQRYPARSGSSFGPPTSEITGGRRRAEPADGRPVH